VSQVSDFSVNLNVVGLNSRTKQRHFGELAARRPNHLDIDHVLERLKNIRSHSLSNLNHLKERFQSRCSENDQVNIYLANDAAGAVSYIGKVTGQDKVLAMNRASAIGELRTPLEENGYKLISTYLAGNSPEDDVEKVLNSPWQLPIVSPEYAFESFAIQNPGRSGGRKDYTALLGVAAAAAGDGSLFFLQHTSNIGTMLQEARRLIVVAGLEKIVDTRDDALFQTRCMGLFGLESVLLDLKLPDRSRDATELEKFPVTDLPPEIHVILLDNGRSEIAEDEAFRDLLVCISCRACAMHCPTHEYFSADSAGYPKRYIWSYLTGDNPSLDLCTGCGMCFLKCPLDIDIPRMVATARSRGASKWPPAPVNRVLNDPWFLMRVTQRSAPAANLFLKNNLARTLLEKSMGLQRDAWLPNARRKTFDKLFRSRK